MEIKKFTSSEGNVWKYVFHFEDAVAEAVLYRYGSFLERTVMCVSVQSGCPVGCKFCGTGKHFIRNLTKNEILYQVSHLVGEVYDMEGITVFNSKKFQIMFMSMGEPMLNFEEVSLACHSLEIYSNVQLLISTVGIKNYNTLNDLLKLSKRINKIGLQFSIHEALEINRNLLIPFKNKLSLREIRDYGILWSHTTGRPVYLNYCVHKNNYSLTEMNILKDLFSPTIFHFTFSVICSSDETKCNEENLGIITLVVDEFREAGYNVRVFNPAGKDDIGGGCGQLWYVQQYLKTLKTK